MLESIKKFPEFSRDAIQIAETVSLGNVTERKFSNVVFVGIGGSAIGGQLIHDWVNDCFPIPITICRGYKIPGFVDRKTLVFTVSYSGNTEETLNAFNQAFKKNATIISIASGGQLEKKAKKKGSIFIKIPEGLIPRAALPYSFFIITNIINKIFPISNYINEISETIDLIDEIKQMIGPEVPSKHNLAKKIAISIKNKIPFVYGTKIFEGVSYRIKTQLNENSKIEAVSGFFPEVFHNAVLASEGPKEIQDSVCYIIIRDDISEKKIEKKIDKFITILESCKKEIIEIRTQGKGKLARMLSTLYVGDYVSTYLGILYGIDPSDMNAIQELKQI
jgi:glucose/mannose-6-phosphate isomerase